MRHDFPRVLETITIDLHTPMAGAVAFTPCEEQVSVPAIRIVALNEGKFLISSKRNKSLDHGSICHCLEMLARPINHEVLVAVNLKTIRRLRARWRFVNDMLEDKTSMRWVHK